MTRLAILLLLLGSARLVLPGDVPFVNDEAMLVERALDANAEGRVAEAGLLGTRGARYGPAPVWFYQTALSFTRDLRTVAVVRTALVTLLTGAALLLLARALGGQTLAPALGAFAFLSPYLWFYARDLWDNSFSIAFSAVLLAAYVTYLKEERAGWLALAGLFAAFCFLTHLMTLPLVGAVAIHFAATRWRSLRDLRFALMVTVIVLACGALCFPYLRSMGGGSMAGFRILPSPVSVWFALGGMRVFTLAGFDYFVGDWGAWWGRGPGWLAFLAVGVTLLSWIAGAAGAIAWGRDALSGSALASPSGRGGDTRLASSVGRLLLLALVLWIILASGLRLREHPHYYNGLWVVFFLFWWRGMSALAKTVVTRRLFAAQAVVMATFLVGLTWTVHENRGLKALHHGPSLSNQIAVARELEREGLEVVQPSEVLHARLFPHAIGVLRRLERGHGPVIPTGPQAGAGAAGDAEGAADSAARAGRVQIVYVDAEGPRGEIAISLPARPRSRVPGVPATPAAAHGSTPSPRPGSPGPDVKRATAGSSEARRPAVAARRR